MNDASLEFLASNLMDTHGVRGIILMDKKSEATATMLNDVYQNLNLKDFREQKIAVEGVFREAANSPEDMFLKFDNGGIYMRQNGLCALSILTSADVNLPSLRIATKLMLRQVTQQSIRELRSAATSSENVETSSRKFDGAIGIQRPKPLTKPNHPGFLSSGSGHEPIAPVAEQSRKNPRKSPTNKIKKRRSSQNDGIWG